MPGAGTFDKDVGNDKAVSPRWARKKTLTSGIVGGIIQGDVGGKNDTLHDSVGRAKAHAAAEFPGASATWIEKKSSR